MEITANRREILSAVKLVSQAAAGEGKGNVGQSLSGIKISAHGGVVKFSATDMEIFLSRSLAIGPDMITMEGSVIVPAKRLASVLADSQNDLITLTATDKALGAKLKGGRINLVRMIEDDYPTEPTIKKKTIAGRINGASWSVGVGRCSFCVSKAADNRYALGGILISLSPDGSILAASDTHRLSSYTLDCEVETPGQIIIPARAASAIAEMADLDGRDIQIRSNGNILQAISANGSATLSLIDGNFPDVARVIPTDHPGRATVNTEDLTKAIKSIGNISDDETRRIDLTIIEDKARLVVDVTESATGNGALQVESVNTGPGLRIAVNCNYMLDALKHVTNDTTTIEYKDADSLILITENNWRHIIMPVKGE